MTRSAEEILLGGRAFHPVGRDTTVEHDVWIMGHVRAIGLDESPMREGEPAGEYAVRLLGQLLASERIFPLLGAFVLPEGVADESWTPALAQETGDYLRTLRAEEDKAAVRSLILSVLIPFLESGLVSLHRTGPSSSPNHDGGPAAPIVRDPLVSASGAG